MTDEHERWEELAVGHVLSALEPEDEEAFAGHVRACAACERTIASMTEVAGQLAYAAEPAEPPAGLKDAILDAVRSSERLASYGAAPESAPPLIGVASSSTWSRARPAAWSRAVGVAAAAVLIAGLGVWNVTLRQNLDVSQRTVARLGLLEQLSADPDTVRVPMSSPGGAEGTALIRDRDVVLVLVGLPENDPASIYVVWYRDRATGSFAAIDTFDVREAGHVNLVESRLSRAFTGIGAIAISREPGRVAPATPSVPLVQGATGQTEAEA